MSLSTRSITPVADTIDWLNNLEPALCEAANTITIENARDPEYNLLEASQALQRMVVNLAAARQHLKLYGSFNGSSPRK